MPQQPNITEQFNITAERAVLGGILIEPEALYRVSDFLVPTMFHLAMHRDVYRAMLSLAERRVSIDTVTLEEQLSRCQNRPQDGWLLWISSLYSEVPAGYQVESYARIVEELFLRRRLKQAAGKIATLSHEDGDIEAQLGEAETAIFAIREGRAGGDIVMPADYVPRSLSLIEERRTREGDMIGVPTGYGDLDRLLGGLIAPFPYVLAARPGVGKSALAINIAAHLALDRSKRVMYFTPEMTAEQLVHRIYAGQTGLSLYSVTHGKHQTGEPLSDAQMTQIHQVAGRLGDAHLFIDPTPGITPGQIRAKSMRMHAEYGLDLIIVDHLHEMSPDNHRDRHLELGDMMRKLKEVGKLVGAPILIVAQLSRANLSRANKRPQMSDLREAGAIEEVAYAILFLYRESYHDDLAEDRLAECIVAKHRDGPTGTVDLIWEAQITSFRNVKLTKERQNGQQPTPIHT